jgi:hypothetical protein
MQPSLDSDMTDLSVIDCPVGNGKYYDIDRLLTRRSEFANEFEPSEDVSKCILSNPCSSEICSRVSPKFSS